MPKKKKTTAKTKREPRLKETMTIGQIKKLQKMHKALELKLKKLPLELKEMVIHLHHGP